MIKYPSIQLLLATSTMVFCANTNAVPASAVQIKVANPNGSQPLIQAEAKGPDKRIYDSTQSTQATWAVSVRGYCSEGSKIFMAHLRGPDGVSHDLQAQGRFLTPDKGHAWEDRAVHGFVSANQQTVMQACNQRAQQLIAQQPNQQEQILNSGIQTRAYPGLEARISLGCSNDSLLFSDALVVDDTVSLPVDAFCAPTGYETPSAADQVPPLVVKAITEIRETIDTPVNTCRLKVAAGFTGTKPNQPISFRWQHGRYRPSTKDYYYDTGPVQHATTGAQPSVVVFDEIEVPAHDKREKGKLRIKVVSPNTMNGPWVNYKMDCTKQISTLQTSLPPVISVKHKVVQEKLINGQLCPTKIRITGKIRGRGDYAGNVLFVGNQYLSSLLPYAVTNGKTTKVKTQRTIQWASTAGTTLQIAGAANTTQPLKTQTIRLGMRVTNSDNEVFASLPQEEHVLKCKLPEPTTITPAGIGLSSTPEPNHSTGVKVADNKHTPAKPQKTPNRLTGQYLANLQIRQGNKNTCTHMASLLIRNTSSQARAIGVRFQNNGKLISTQKPIRLKTGERRQIRVKLNLKKGKNKIVATPIVKGVQRTKLASLTEHYVATCK